MTDSSVTTQQQQSDPGVAERARGTAETAQEQAGMVAEEAKAQVRTVVDEAKGQLRDQAESQAERAASSLRRASDEVEALLAGRPEDATAAQRYLEEMRARLDDAAAHIERRGFEGLMDDLTGFARRRPGAFLAGAAAAGFVAGRLFRSASSDGHQTGRQEPRQPMAPGEPADEGAARTRATAPPPDAIDLREEVHHG